MLTMMRGIPPMRMFIMDAFDGFAFPSYFHFSRKRMCWTNYRRDSIIKRINPSITPMLAELSLRNGYCSEVREVNPYIVFVAI